MQKVDAGLELLVDAFVESLAEEFTELFAA
jgi:hypothetical protein